MMLKTKLLERLKQIDIKNTQEHHVALLPDFFVDHFVTLKKFDDTCSAMKEIVQQGGGNLPKIAQIIHQGGNAANTALALARLGTSAHLICRTNEFGLHLLKYFLGKEGVDLSGVKTDGKLAITTALEFGEEHTNIMLSDAGSVSDFSFELLNECDKKTIADADMACVLNWNLNKEGTTLAQKVFSFAKEHDTKTFFDTGDPSPRKEEIMSLMKNVFTSGDLDILGLNKNELFHYSKIKASSDEDLINAARSLKQQISSRIDLHTERFACTINESCKTVQTLKISKIYRSTGAGDAWNAGDIFAELLGFNDDERLLFANAVAGYYVSSAKPVHPTVEDIIQFISNEMQD